MKKETLYQLLIDQKNELSQRIEKIEADLKNRYVSRQSSLEAVDHSNDDVLDGLKKEAQTKLDLTQNAIHRLTDGVFGHCIKCNNEMSDERLKALPHTQFCHLCAQTEAGSTTYPPATPV
jgi:DnaK suppressor protein